MKLIRFFLIFALSLHLTGAYGFCNGPDADAEKSSDSLIEAFSYYDMPEQVTGCSCSFHLDGSENELVFFSDMGKIIWMKIEGKYVTLHPREPVVHRVGDTLYEELGHKITYSYAGDGIDIDIELEVTSVCPSYSKACEVQYFKGTFTAVKGKRSHTVKVTGHCGC